MGLCAGAAETETEIPAGSVQPVTIDGLENDRTYYVRIRAYKIVGNDSFLSAWSGTQDVTTLAYEEEDVA